MDFLFSGYNRNMMGNFYFYILLVCTEHDLYKITIFNLVTTYTPMELILDY